MGFFSDLTTTMFGGGDTSSVNNSGGMNVGQGMNVSNGINANYGVNEGGSFSNSTSSGGSSQDVWGQQSPFLESVYQGAQGSYNDAMGSINSMTPAIQNQISSAAGSAAGGYNNQMGGGFASGLAGQVGPNAYTSAMKSQIADDANLMRQQSLGGLDARAAASGMSGSSGYRDQVSGMNDDINRQALNAMTGVGYNSFNQGVQNQMALAGQMDSNQQNAMGNLQNIQQGSMNQYNPAMAGLNAAGQYGQIIGGPTTLSQSTQNSNSTNSSFNNGMNMGLGMNQAVGVNNSYGSNVGNQASVGSTQTGVVPGIASGIKAGTDAGLIG